MVGALRVRNGEGGEVGVVAGGFPVNFPATAGGGRPAGVVAGVGEWERESLSFLSLVFFLYEYVCVCVWSV